MHPSFHEGRRKARARALNRKYRNHDGVVYTDALDYYMADGAVAIFVIKQYSK